MDDPAALRAHLTGHRRKTDAALDMVADHLERHGGYVAWSGGKDSTVVADLTHQVMPDVPIVTYVAGTEYPEVLPYCAEVAEARGWTWETIRTGDIWEVLRDGDGLADDRWWEIMIAGPAAEARARHGDGLLWGMRAEESRARLGLLGRTRGRYIRPDGVAACAPVWDWWSRDIYAYLSGQGIPLCPVYARLEAAGAPERARRVGRMIGRRGSGAGRYMWLRRGWPDEWTRLAEVVPWLRDVS